MPSIGERPNLKTRVLPDVDGAPSLLETERRKHLLRSFLLVSDLIPRYLGGGMRFFAALGRRSTEQGIRMGVLLAGEPAPSVADLFRESGITWWSLPDWKTSADRERRWRFISGFRRVNALEPWDVVAFEHCKPLSVICACTWSHFRDGRRFARVWHQHQGIPSPRGVKKYLSTIRLVAPFMDALVGLSELGAESFRKRRCPAHKIRVMYNGVHVPKSLPRCWLRPKLGLQDSARILVTVASLIPRKGLDVLCRAVAPLFKESSQWHLVVVGAGPLLVDLQELTQQLGIHRQVHFTGPSSSVPEILVDCDAFVLASRNEAMPVSILEAMASSLPVVATDVGSVREVVVHRKTGLVVPPEDPAALGAALRNVMMDEKLARAFGAAGRERVERFFSLEQQVDRYLSLYRGVCH